MASLQKNKVGKHTYWRIVESRRVNGKPRPIPILHLGTANKILERFSQAGNGGLKVQSYQHGDVAALKAMADRLQLVSLIDRHIPKSRRPLSVGTTLLVAVLNRVIDPRSKRAWSQWAKDTSIHRLIPLEGNKLTSQYFWDQMDAVSVEALEKIEDELTKMIVKEFDIKLDTVFYDTTNFFTYVASDNVQSELTQRGYSKQKRTDLRQFSLALLVSKDGQIPLCSEVYKGNTADVTQFKESFTQIRKRLENLFGNIEDATLVYDKGNNSKENQAMVDKERFYYVASLTPSYHKDLLDIKREKYKPIPSSGSLAGIPVYRCKKMIWGEERTLIMFVSLKLREGQIRGLNQQLTKRLQQLKEWKARLKKPQSGPLTKENAKKQINQLLSGQCMKQVLDIEYDEKKKGGDRLTYKVNKKAQKHLQEEVFGKRILMTNRHEWTDEEIMKAYRGQSEVEDVFKQIKNPKHLAVRPQFHWTDQKIRVHTFICLLGFTLARLVELETRRKTDWVGSLPSLLDLLGKVRLAMVLQVNKGSKRKTPSCQWILESGNEEAVELFKQIVPKKAPFVYTHQTT